MNAIIVAAGSSRRMGFDKLRASLAGRPVLWQSIRALAVCPQVAGITLVTRREAFDEAAALAESAALGKPVSLVVGGAERHLSVWEGMRSLACEAGYVCIHDAARPLVSPCAVEGCFTLAERYGSGICAAPIVDTVKRADASNLVFESVERDGLWAMQTPQIFDLQLLREAYSKLMEVGEAVTDEGSAIQRLRKPVALYHNVEWNFKITVPADLALAELVMQARRHFVCEEVSV
jgi:2-C-methyl-D-erythritol 4-phosphate cytidylyltransferase